jgi:hypothetical protein
MTYAPPPPQPYYPAPRTSTTALISLISGIAGWFVLPIIGPIIAVITGHMAKGEIRNSMGQVTGDGLATAGLVLGYIQLIGALCGCVIFAVLMIMGVSIPFLGEFNF